MLAWMHGRHSTSPTLLARLQNPRDREAWAQFDLLYRDLILRYCRGRGLQPADAEDVTQIVQTSLVSSLRTFTYDPDRGHFRDYLRGAVKHAVYRFLAQTSRNPKHLEASALEGEIEEAGDEDDELWEREWRHHHLRHAMRTLRRSSSPRQIEAFEALLAGASVEDVAARTGSSVDAVYKAKQRMRSRLRELVAQQIRNEDGADG